MVAMKGYLRFSPGCGFQLTEISVGDVFIRTAGPLSDELHDIKSFL
jgi:hypothetical protein